MEHGPKRGDEQWTRNEANAGWLLAHWADVQIRRDVSVDYVRAWHTWSPNFGTTSLHENATHRGTRPRSYLRHRPGASFLTADRTRATRAYAMRLVQPFFILSFLPPLLSLFVSFVCATLRPWIWCSPPALRFIEWFLSFCDYWLWYDRNSFSFRLFVSCVDEILKGLIHWRIHSFMIVLKFVFFLVKWIFFSLLVLDTWFWIIY